MKESNLVFTSPLKKRTETKHIIVYHSGIKKHKTVEEIHKIFIQRDMAGIGYHFYVDKKGEIFLGRPIDTVGAHTRGYNSNSIVVCFDGDFSQEVISDEQISDNAIMLLFFLKNAYHADLLFYDELPGHKPLVGLRKDRFEYLLGECFNWFYNESLRVYDTAGEGDFHDFLEEFHADYGIPFNYSLYGE